jgi:hypothetical protein
VARNSKVDTCLLCGEAPCVCNKPAATPKAARAPRVKAESKAKPQSQVETLPEPSRPSALEAMRARAAVDALSKPPALQVYQEQQKESRNRRINQAPMSVVEMKVKFVVPDETDEESEFRTALEALAPLLHPDELNKYRNIIPQPQVKTVSERAAEWRSRAAES